MYTQLISTVSNYERVWVAVMLRSFTFNHKLSSYVGSHPSHNLKCCSFRTHTHTRVFNLSVRYNYLSGRLAYSVRYICSGLHLSINLVVNDLQFLKVTIDTKTSYFTSLPTCLFNYRLVYHGDSLLHVSWSRLLCVYKVIYELVE